MRSILIASWAVALLLGSAELRAQARITTSEFIQQAAMSDLFEIDASKLAVEKADSKDVKSFAERMVKEHSASFKALTDAAQRGQAGVAPPSELDSEHKARIALLRNASGVEFDKLYVDLQTGAHEFALKLHGAYAKTGDNGELKAVAGEIAGHVEEHLAKIREIKRIVDKKS
jgi:putative membrane protein